MGGKPYHEKDVLERLYYEEKLSQKEIADRFGVARNTISSWMNRHDIGPGQALGGKREREKQPTPEYQKREVLETLYYEEGLTQQEIADRFDIAFQVVSDWMVKHDINPGEEAGHFDRVERASHFWGSHGYENVAAWNSEKKRMEHVKVHRLIAVAKYGFEEVQGMDVHHKNEHKVDNRFDNIELKTAGEHMHHHGEKQVEWMERDSETGRWLKSKKNHS